jgi:hypothetical protein
VGGVAGEHADWRGHVIVSGLGVGLRIVEQLSLSGVPAVVIDELSAPFGVAVTADGGFLIADTFNDEVRNVAAG